MKPHSKMPTARRGCDRLGTRLQPQLESRIHCLFLHTTYNQLSVDIPLVMYTAYHNAIPLVAIALWTHMGNKQFSVLGLKIALGRSSLKTSSLMNATTSQTTVLTLL